MWRDTSPLHAAGVLSVCHWWGGHSPHYRLVNMGLSTMAQPFSVNHQIMTPVWMCSSRCSHVPRGCLGAGWARSNWCGTGSRESEEWRRWPGFMSLTVTRLETMHYKLCGMISSRSLSEPTIRHGHQLIFLMKVDWFWYSEMKRRFWQFHTLMSRLLIVKKTLFSSQNTKINHFSSGKSAGAHV